MNQFDRLLKLLPRRWFSDAAVSPGGGVYAVLQAIAGLMQYCQDGLDYVKAQMRIGTATGVNLENISFDFFGGNLPKKSGEGDDSFRARIKGSMFIEKGTRIGIKKAIEALGAQVVEIYEPTVDGFFTDYCCTDATRISDLDPYEGIFFIRRAQNPVNTNLLFTDYNYTDYNYVPGEGINIWQIQDSDIFNAVENTKACGTRVWVVLDPITVTDTTTGNYISTERYYVPAIGPGLPTIFTLDSSVADGSDVVL